MKKTILKVIALTCIASLALVACSSKDSTSKESTTTTTKAKESTTEKKSIVELAQGNENFTSLLAAVQAAELGELLATDGTFTIFAPVNAAFEKLDATQRDALMANKVELTKVLTYHAVATEVLKSADLTDGQEITTAEGSKLTIGVKDGKITVTTDAGVTANVVGEEIVGSNGVIHVIDTVLLPANLAL